MRFLTRISALALVGLGACTATEEPLADTVSRAEFSPEYLGVETRLLQDDLISFVVQMRGARDAEDVAAYSRCAAAQYTLIRGYSFAQHIRTRTGKEGGLWAADAVYTISQEFPDGVVTLRADDVVAQCKSNGIPTV